MVPLWAFFLGGIFSLSSQAKYAFRSFTIVSIIALLTHILGDILTTWGTQILWPLSDYKASLETSFVIDPFITALVLIPLLIALYRNRRVFASLGIFLLVLYVTMQAMIKVEMRKTAESYANSRQISDASITILPQPLSPFNWKLIINDDSQYHLARVSLLLRNSITPESGSTGLVTQFLSHYHPPGNLQWQTIHPLGKGSEINKFARQAFQHPEFARFRRFAKLPLLVGIERKADETCASFTDLRFHFPVIKNPLIYSMCLSQEGKWQHK